MINVGNHLADCFFPWWQPTKRFPLFQSLPSELVSYVMDFMTGPEICRLVTLDPARIGRDCLTLQHIANYYMYHRCTPKPDFIGFLRRSGQDFHVPSNQRLMRILCAFHEGEPVLCDLCHAKETNYFCSHWGLLKCKECWRYHDQHDEYQVERFPGIRTHRLACRKNGPRKYFVRWAGADMLTKFSPLLNTDRLATSRRRSYWGCGFHTICVLAEPAFDPCTGERCGPLMTHKDIDEMDGCYSQDSVDALVASFNMKKDRLMQLGCLAHELSEQDR